MTLLSILLTLSTSILFRLFRYQADMTGAAAQSIVWTRLVRDFRADAHNARDAQLVGEANSSLVFQTGAERIAWDFRESAVRRRINTVDALQSDQSPTEDYFLSGIRVTFALQSDDRQPRAALMASSSAESLPMGASRTIEAVVGLNHRFERETLP